MPQNNPDAYKKKKKKGKKSKSVMGRNTGRGNRSAPKSRSLIHHGDSIPGGGGGR